MKFQAFSTLLCIVLLGWIRPIYAANNPAVTGFSNLADNVFSVSETKAMTSSTGSNANVSPQLVCSVVFEGIGAPQCIGGNIHLNLFITGQDLSQTGFNVFHGNQPPVFLPFEADNTYSVVLPNLGNPNFVLTICDAGNPTCCRERAFQNPCYQPNDCTIVFEETVASTCQNGSVQMTLFINGENNSETGYDVFLNDTFLVFLPYQQDHIYDLLFDDPGTPGFILTICDNDNPNCCRDREFENPCYEPGGDCSIVFEEIGNLECENGNVYMSLVIIGQNISQTGFDVYLNDSFLVFLPFEADNMYNLVFPNPGTQGFFLTVCDNDNPNCCRDREFENPCYEPGGDCSIVFEEIGNLECENGNVYMSLVIIGQNISQTGFDVYLNDSFLVFLPFEADNMYNLVFPNPGTQGFVLTICDNDNPNCCRDREFENPCYEPGGDCSIVFEEIGNLECENGNVYMSLVIIGQNISQTGFDVYLNDSFLVFLPYEADSIYNLLLPNPGTLGFVLTICDNDNPNCCRDREFENPCYEPGGDCSIVYEEIGNPVCDSNYISMSLIIVGQNLSQTGFDVYLNDSFVVFLPYEADSIYNLLLPNPGTLGFVLTICDNDNPNCCRDREFENPCYEPGGDCSIVFEEIGNPVCDSNYISMSLIIVGQNLSQTGFDVYLNDSFVVFLPFEADSIYNIVLPDPGTQGFVLTICDNDNANCCREREFENPCSGQQLCIIEEFTATMDSIGTDSFLVTILYDLSGNCPDTIPVTIILNFTDSVDAEIIHGVLHIYGRRVQTDSIHMEACFTFLQDSCLQFAMANPFSSRVGDDFLPNFNVLSNGQEVIISNPSRNVYEWQLMDMASRRVNGNSSEQSDQRISMQHLPDGMYILLIRHEHRVYVYKIMHLSR